MGTFQTALGEEFSVERRLQSLGWRPRLRSTLDGAVRELRGAAESGAYRA